MGKEEIREVQSAEYERKNTGYEVELVIVKKKWFTE